MQPVLAPSLPSGCCTNRLFLTISGTAKLTEYVVQFGRLGGLLAIHPGLGVGQSVTLCLADQLQKQFKAVY
jgi:hypothetical protein